MIEINPVVDKSRVYEGFETWEDPGVYPSGAGAGPMRSRRYYEAGGDFIVVFTESEMNQIAVDWTEGTDWFEVIMDFIRPVLEFGKIESAEVKYSGAGKFVVSILEANYV